MKSNFVEQERRLAAALGLNRRPVAVTFADSIPPGIAAFAGSVPAGCSFWKIAAEGKTFHTIPGDHFNCAVGSHTHNIALPEARAHELGDTLTLMSAWATYAWKRFLESFSCPTLRRRLYLRRLQTPPWFPTPSSFAPSPRN